MYNKSSFYNRSFLLGIRTYCDKSCLFCLRLREGEMGDTFLCVTGEVLWDGFGCFYWNWARGSLGIFERSGRGRGRSIVCFLCCSMSSYVSYDSLSSISGPWKTSRGV